MKCALVTKGGDVVSTNAGILFFGRYPQQHVIQGEVVCVLFRDAVGASRYADRKIITGTLQELIDGAEAFLNRYIAVGPGWRDGSVLIFQSTQVERCARGLSMLWYTATIVSGVRV